MARTDSKRMQETCLIARGLHARVFTLLWVGALMLALGASSLNPAIGQDPLAPSEFESDAQVFNQEHARAPNPETPPPQATHATSSGSLPVLDPHMHLPMASPRGSGDCYLDPYRVRVSESDGDSPDSGQFNWHGDRSVFGEVPTDALMWWDSLVGQPLGFSKQTLKIDVQSLTTSALASSPQIRSLLATPQIKQSDVTIADAEFDTLLFLDGKFANENDPVGNELTTGDNSTRFRDESFSSNLGLRKRSRNGGELELIQRGGYQKNNSIFLQPNPQGTTRLELNFTQPLRKDAGRFINQSRIVVAQLQTNQASSLAREQLETHLFEVTRAYWDVYRARAKWLQQQKLIGSGRQLHDLLDSRSGFDAGRRQILRSRAALASRQVGLSRAASQIKDAQARLRMLVGSSQLIDVSHAEWLTVENPLPTQMPVNSKQATIEALENRNDISRAIQAIHEVSVRVGAARNQVLPQLDLLLGTYVAGLDPGRDTLGAFENQFTDGRPGFSIGLAYELPVGNRAAKSRLNRNRWELFQIIQDFRQTTESAITEVEIAARETQTAWREMLEKRLAIQATEAELSYLTQRYQELPGEQDSLVLLIDNLISAQERLAEQEGQFTDAQVAYAVSWVNFRKSKGVLLRFADIVTEQSVTERVSP